MKLDELAKLAGVSRTTVSYVVNGKAKKYRVSDNTIAKVEALIKKYNFKPNAMAAGLRAGKTYTIGLIIPDFENQSYAKIANRLENIFRKKGYQLLIGCTNDDPKNEMECAKHFFQRQIDALIVSTSLPIDTHFYQKATNIPVFGFDRQISSPDILNLTTDDEDDAYRLSLKLVQQNANSPQHILFVGALPELPTSQQREAGFRKGITEQKVDVLYAERFLKESAETAFTQWLKNNPMPEGIFVTSFTLLQGILRVLLQQNGNIPKNLHIATFGHHEMLDLLENPVFCCMQDHNAVADTLVSLVLNKINKKKALINQTAIGRKILVRGSVTG